MIYQLSPVTKDYLWGGSRLKTEFHKAASSANVAESWELSCHPAGPSVISALGIPLEKYLRDHPENLGSKGEKFQEFPILVKLIDAKKDLSIQVHPEDAYAKAHENQLGKTEMWYILDAEPDAFIYYGFAEAMTPDDFARSIEEKTLTDYLKKIPVKPGDFFFIPAGTIHAIGAGCFIAEVQQSSDVTYRVYDFDRKDAQGKTRQLHVDQAKAVTQLSVQDQDFDFLPHLAQCDYFTVDLLKIEDAFTLTVDQDSFAHFLFLAENMTIRTTEKYIRTNKGMSVFADAGTGKVRLEGQGTILMTSLR